MKITGEQLTWLQNTLRERITYIETYEEVYDHILSALEQTDNNNSLIQAVGDILQNDFGGFKGVRLLERKRRWFIGRQILTKQFWCFLRHFKFPLLPVTVVLYGLIYYLVTNLDFRPYGFFMVVIMFIQICLFGGLRYFNTGYNKKDTTKSIKDLPFKIVSHIPIYILFGGNYIRGSFFREIDFSNWLNLHPLVVTAFCTMYVTYNISLVMLYRDEFKKLDTKLI